METDGPRPSSRRPRGQTVALALAFVVVVAAGVAWVSQQAGNETVCTLAAHSVDPPPGHEGAEAWLQDSGEPGNDRCDGDDTPPLPREAQASDSGLPAPSSTSLPPRSAPDVSPPPERLVLGFDCGFRDADGTVVATTTPNRADGTCGLPGG